MKLLSVIALLGLVSQSIAIAPKTCPTSVQCPPDKNSTDVIQLPDPDNCGAFCKCVGGVAIFNPCPKGLLYNTELQVCDFPADVNCGNRPKPPSVQDVADLKKCPDDVTAKCPSDDPQNPVYYPYPGDDHRFCVCSNGVAWEQTCPADLIFDLTKDVCVGPGANKCDSKVSSSCPLVDPTPPLYLADPGDCHKFCECSGGVAYLQKCPADLVFSPDKDVCVHPDEYPCTTGSVGTMQDGKRCDPIVSSRCPSDDTGSPTYFPYPGDCHRFCQCSHGVAYEFNCGALIYDASKHVCVYPGSVKCATTF